MHAIALQTNLDAARADLQNAQDEVLRSSEDVKRLEGENAELTAARTQLQNENTELETVKAQLEQTNAEVRGFGFIHFVDSADLEFETGLYSNVSQAHATSLQGTLDATRQELKNGSEFQLRQALQEANATVEKHREDADRMLSEIGGLKASKTRLQSKNTELRKQAKQTNAEVRTLMSTHRQVRSR